MPPRLLLEAPSVSPAESWEGRGSEAGGRGQRGWKGMAGRACPDLESESCFKLRAADFKEKPSHGDR